MCVCVCVCVCSVLQDCHRQLHADLTDKNTAVQIDSECCQLENTSEDIGMQEDPTRIKKGYISLHTPSPSSHIHMYYKTP